MPGGVGNPFAHEQHGISPGTMTQAEANALTDSSGNQASGTASSNTNPPPSTIYTIPPPVYDLTGSGPCSWSQSGSNPAWNRTGNVAVDPVFGTNPTPRTTWNYPVVLLSRNCETNALRFIKTIDIVLMVGGAMLAILGAAAGAEWAIWLGLIVFALGVTGPFSPYW